MGILIYTVTKHLYTEMPPWLVIISQVVSTVLNVKNKCTEHGSHNAMICAQFQQDSSTQINVFDKQDWGQYHFV